jgi:hypothetical protein
MCLRICRSFKSVKMIGFANPKSASHKNLGPKIAIATFAEDLLIYETSQVLKFDDLQFAKLNREPPTFNIYASSIEFGTRALVPLPSVQIHTNIYSTVALPHLRRSYEGNTEEENNGYVVFK